MSKKSLEIFQSEVLDETVQISLYELCERCGGVKAELIIEMVEYGLLEPTGASPAEWYFTAVAVQRSRTALHLQRDLGVNWAGAALALDLLEELQALRARLQIFEQS